jgi:ABC-type nitrate/sulfonate/bicarbonate transport system permease component
MRVSSRQLWSLGPEALAGNSRWAGVVVRYSPLLIIAIAWELAARLPLLPARVLPPLSAVLDSWVRLVVSGELVTNGLDSLYRLGVGLFLAVFVGTAAGLLMATSRSVNVFIGPIVRLFYPMPKSALIPVMVLWLGFGDASKIVLIFLGCLLPVAISAFNGARGVERTLVWSARSFGAGRLALIGDVILPGALPDILSGIRIALATSFVLLVSSELVAARRGLGFMIGMLGDGGVYDAMFATVLTIAVLGFLADRAYLVFMRRMLRWRE